MRYEQIAAWMRADVDRVSQALGQKGRINQENWIEQAQILAKSGTTVYSTRRALGQGRTAAPTPDEGERGPPAPSAPLPRPMSRVGVSAAVVAPPPDPKPAVASAPMVAERAAFAGAPAQARRRCRSVRPSRRAMTTCSASAALPLRSSRSCLPLFRADFGALQRRVGCQPRRPSQEASRLPPPSYSAVGGG